MEVVVGLLVLVILGLGLLLNKQQGTKSEFTREMDLIFKDNYDLMSQLGNLTHENDNHKRELEVLKATHEATLRVTPDVSNMVDKQTYEATRGKLELVEIDLDETRVNLATMKSEKKSKEVRLGQISEVLLPFLDGFEYDPKSLSALFQPIDYISFGEDEIVFIEVKSGGAQLSTKQRRIRDQIKEGKVRFEIYRLGENGIEVKNG